jgi:predicted NBD/HSP70 family sugar kinase
VDATLMNRDEGKAGLLGLIVVEKRGEYCDGCVSNTSHVVVC